MAIKHAELRQFENGHNRPEVAIVLVFDEGTMFSIVGYDNYKQALAEFGTPDDVLREYRAHVVRTQGTPGQPVFYDYDEEFPEEHDCDPRALQTLANLRNEYVVLAEVDVLHA